MSFKSAARKLIHELLMLAGWLHSAQALGLQARRAHPVNGLAAGDTAIADCSETMPGDARPGTVATLSAESYFRAAIALLLAALMARARPRQRRARPWYVWRRKQHVHGARAAGERSLSRRRTCMIWAHVRPAGRRSRRHPAAEWVAQAVHARPVRARQSYAGGWCSPTPCNGDLWLM